MHIDTLFACVVPTESSRDVVGINAEVPDPRTGMAQLTARASIVVSFPGGDVAGD